MPDVNAERAAVPVLGWGLASEPVAAGADIGRDLVLRDGKLVLVAGVANLLQSLETALTTALGDDVFNTAFGFDGPRVLAMAVDPVLAREGIRVAVIDVLRRDPRVTRIVDVTLVDPPVGEGARRTTTVRCEIQTVAGGPLAVTVEGVVARV